MKARLAGAIALVLALSGCALSTGSAQSPSEARDAFRAVLDGTQQVLGGEWEISDDPTARGCVIPLWVDGTRYPALRLAPPPADSDAAVQLVSAHWEELGYSIEISTVGDATELEGTNPYGALVIFRISSDAMTLQGESECRPAS